MVTYTWTSLNSNLTELFHIYPKRNYGIKGMILILINETLRIFFYGIRVTTTEPSTMIRIFGNGTPWWHIQDTAVAMFHFNGNYDIHVGGLDLCYPHHEVLRAILMALSRKKNPVKCWMHVGILDIESTKMSKSSGNAIYVRDLLKKFDANTLKLYFYSLDYKKLINFKISELIKFEGINTMIRNIVSTLRS